MFDQSNFFTRYEIKTNEATKQRKTCFKTGANFVSQLLRDWSKSIGGGGGAFGNVVDKKHMTHPLPSAQK